LATADEVEERDREKERYLVAFYELTKDEPLRWATHRDIAKVAQIPDERIMTLSMQLQGDEFVQLRTMGGIDGSVELTPKGVRVAEQAIKESAAAPRETSAKRSDQEWATANMPMLKFAFEVFAKEHNWPQVDVLQRALDRAGTGIDVRSALVEMPRLQGDVSPAYPTNFYLPIRILRFVPEATSVLDACVEIVRRAVDIYYSDTEELSISSDDPWVALLGDRDTLATSAQLLLSDFPNPFAGGGYGPGASWRLSVNGSMARRFRDIDSVEDYVARQKIIRDEDQQQFAALVHYPRTQPDDRATTPGGMAGGSGVDEESPTIFVMMPFGEPWSQGIYDLIKRAVRSIGYPGGGRIVRADEISAPGKIDQQIIGAIRAASVVIADITGTNANVMWELGYAQALLKSAVIMNQHVGESPFDLASTRQVSYRLTPTDDDESKLADHIRAAVGEAWNRASDRPSA